MSEYLCPITKRLCPRPGEVAPGAVVTSAEGYCGGKNPEDGICPKIPESTREKGPLLENLIFKRVSTTRVTISRSVWPSEHSSPSELIYIIESGLQTLKTKPNLPDLSRSR